MDWHNQSETAFDAVNGQLNINGTEVNQSEATNILNHHSKTSPSSAPIAVAQPGLPWKYEMGDDQKHIAGSLSMLKWIHSETEDNEVEKLTERHDNGELEKTWN